MNRRIWTAATFAIACAIVPCEATAQGSDDATSSDTQEEGENESTLRVIWPRDVGSPVTPEACPELGSVSLSFDLDERVLDDTARTQLQAIAECAEQTPGALLRVHGSASNMDCLDADDGCEAHVLELATDRARTVEQYLQDHDVAVLLEVSSPDDICEARTTPSALECAIVEVTWWSLAD